MNKEIEQIIQINVLRDVELELYKRGIPFEDKETTLRVLRYLEDEYK